MVDATIVSYEKKKKNKFDIRNGDFNGIIRNMLKREFHRSF